MTSITTLALDGELTIYRAAETRTGLLAALSDSPEGLEIDLAGVTEIDSAGVQLLMAARRDAQARGQWLRFTGCNGPVSEVFALFDLTAFFGETLTAGIPTEGDAP